MLALTASPLGPRSHRETGPFHFRTRMATQVQLRIRATTVTEGSVMLVAFAFTDDDGAASTPTSIRYRVDSPETGAELVAWTSVSASSDGSFTVPAAAHVIEDDANQAERRHLTVEADAGLVTAFKAVRPYWVRNTLGTL